MGASDSIVLDDPRGPSNLLSCQKLCGDLVFLLDCVLAGSSPHGRSVAVFLLW